MGTSVLALEALDPNLEKCHEVWGFPSAQS